MILGVKIAVMLGGISCRGQEGAMVDFFFCFLKINLFILERECTCMGARGGAEAEGEKGGKNLEQTLL